MSQKLDYKVTDGLLEVPMLIVSQPMSYQVMLAIAP